MKAFLISDNHDTLVLMKLAGIKGVVAHGREESLKAFSQALSMRNASNPASVDVFVGGPGDDTYVGGNGENLYTWELRGGDDTIVNNSAKSTLWLGGEIGRAHV